MQVLPEQISSYLAFLENTCGYYVSVHFTVASVTQLPNSLILPIMRFNSHKSPLCMQVKNGNHALCVKTQREIHERHCSELGFCNTCHAGICQYLYPIYSAKGYIGFTAISGACCNSHENAPVYFTEDHIPQETLASILAPLSIMLGKFWDDHAVTEENEYHQILQYLHEYHSSVSLTDLCAHFGRSKSHISHLFKKNSGVSLNAYCNTLKLSDARRLLLTSNLSVTEIAFHVGFCSTSYFIQLFRQAFGISPLHYKKSHTIKKAMRF